MRATHHAGMAAFATALLLWGGMAAPPALAQSLPAPTLWITAETCQALLQWTHDNPDNLRIYNYRYRVRGDGESSWDSWNNVDGGASARNVSVRSYRAAGHHEYQVQAAAITIGNVVFSNPSNSATAYLINFNSRYCQEGGE